MDALLFLERREYVLFDYIGFADDSCSVSRMEMPREHGRISTKVTSKLNRRKFCLLSQRVLYFLLFTLQHSFSFFLCYRLVFSGSVLFKLFSPAEKLSGISCWELRIIHLFRFGNCSKRFQCVSLKNMRSIIIILIGFTQLPFVLIPKNVNRVNQNLNQLHRFDILTYSPLNPLIINIFHTLCSES